MGVTAPGVNEFIELSDTPSTYAGSATKSVVVNGGATALEFAEAGGGVPGGSDTQVQFNDGGVFGGDAHFTYDKTNDVLHVHKLAGDATDGLLLESESGVDIGVMGMANTANATWYGNHNYNAVTASRAAQFGASKTLESSSVTNTELGYLSGVTSAIQTQIGNKQDTLVSGTNIKTVNGTTLLGSGDLAVTGTTNLSYTAATRVIASDTGTDATLPLMSSGDAGLVPASGGGTTNFLRADGTFAAPAGGSGLTALQVFSAVSIRM